MTTGDATTSNRLKGSELWASSIAKLPSWGCSQAVIPSGLRSASRLAKSFDEPRNWFISGSLVVRYSPHEDLYDDMERWLDANKSATEGLYIVDSLDALSDDAEMHMDIQRTGAPVPVQD